MVAEIVTRTEEVQIITVYGPDYDAMSRKSTWCVAGFTLCLFGGMLGIVPALIRSNLIDFNTSGGITILLGCSVMIALSSVFFLNKHRTLYRDLLLQNGWNPKYKPELKLDYQTFLHD